MKLAAIQVDLVNIPYVFDIASASSAAGGTTKCIVQVRAEDGLIGLGEAPGGEEVRADILRAFEPIRGCDPFRVEWILERMPGPHRGLYGPTPTAQSAVEMALWDIMGKAVGRPVADLLGGRYRETVPVCAPLFTREAHEADFTAATLAMAEEVAARWGFRAFKVKAGVYRPGSELPALRKLRERFGSGVALRIDPNGVWSPEETIGIARRAAELDLEWLEDPTWGIEAMARVRQAVAVPLATNMCVRTFDQLPVAFRLGAVDVVLGDPRIWGGMWPTRKLGAALEGFNIGFGLHSSHECGIATAARLQLAAATAHLSYAIDVTHWFHGADVIVGGPWPIHDGAMTVPTGPGLGVELDPERLAEGVARHAKEGTYPARLTNPSRYRWWV